jgi:hypothetical protein
MLEFMLAKGIGQPQDVGWIDFLIVGGFVLVAVVVGLIMAVAEEDRPQPPRKKGCWRVRIVIENCHEDKKP